MAADKRVRTAVASPYLEVIMIVVTGIKSGFDFVFVVVEGDRRSDQFQRRQRIHSVKNGK